MSPGLKFCVTALGPALNTVIAALSRDVVLPFVRVRVPMHLAQAAGMHGHHRGGDGLRDALKLRLSAMRTSPPAVLRVGGMPASWKRRRVRHLAGACLAPAPGPRASGPGIWPGKM